MLFSNVGLTVIYIYIYKKGIYCICQSEIDDRATVAKYDKMIVILMPTLEL